MEKTINDGKEKTAYQLKKLLGKKKNQDLGDKSRWENIPVNYIVTANTLGVELNDPVLKRLNGSGDKEQAFYSVMLTQYFSREMRKQGKQELATELEAMVENEAIATDELGIYALESIKKALPEKAVMEKLAKAYFMEHKDGISDKPGNQVDIVLLPMGKDNLHKDNVRVYMSEIPEDFESAIFNIYGREENLRESAGIIRNQIKDSLDRKMSLDSKGRNKHKSYYASAIIAGTIVSLVGGLFALIYKDYGGESNLAMGMMVGGGIAGSLAFIGYNALLAYAKGRDIKKAKKQIEQLNDNLSKSNVNLIHSKALENAYAHAMAVQNGTWDGRTLHLSEVTCPVVRRAIEQTVKSAENEKDPFISTYGMMLGELGFLEFKEKFKKAEIKKQDSDEEYFYSPRLPSTPDSGKDAKKKRRGGPYQPPFPKSSRWSR
ncbi:MAG: hypothetical protein ABIB71_06460 [Candidatus Woesearchaeota archaeon]